MVTFMMTFMRTFVLFYFFGSRRNDHCRWHAIALAMFCMFRDIQRPLFFIRAFANEQLDITLENPEFDAKFKIVAKGKMMRLPPKFVEISTGEIEEAVDAHTIQPYYTVLLAEECGMQLGHSATAEEIVFTADVVAA